MRADRHVPAREDRTTPVTVFHPRWCRPADQTPQRPAPPATPAPLDARCSLVQRRRAELRHDRVASSGLALRGDELHGVEELAELVDWPAPALFVRYRVAGDARS